eukprot:Unigene6193_Nuclearia_a/m.19052 Unigene6193_Nuclearia_a/g.19052  ORF Unigene6193_Nuclearia_a/g.19052 Unigene6193_Nuclearia_a/m.19052 type:complete len:1438 (-) Unigene6193_Nuclearia_a:54-4367(-)
MFAPSDVELGQALRGAQLADPFVQPDALAARVAAAHPTWHVAPERVAALVARVGLRTVQRADASGGQRGTRAAPPAVRMTAPAPVASLPLPAVPAPVPAPAIAPVPALIAALAPANAPFVWPPREAPLVATLRTMRQALPNATPQGLCMMLRALSDSGWEALNVELVATIMHRLSQEPPPARPQVLPLPQLPLPQLPLATSVPLPAAPASKAQTKSAGREDAKRFFLQLSNLTTMTADEAQAALVAAHPDWRIAHAELGRAFRAAQQSANDKLKHLAHVQPQAPPLPPPLPAQVLPLPPLLLPTQTPVLVNPAAAVVPSGKIVMAIPLDAPLGSAARTPAKSSPAKPHAAASPQPNGAHSPQHRTPYAPYISRDEAVKLVLQGQAIVGMVVVRDQDSAEVTRSDSETRDFLQPYHERPELPTKPPRALELNNQHARNRVLSGDVAVVRINSSMPTRGTVVHIARRSTVAAVVAGYILPPSHAHEAHTRLNEHWRLFRPNELSFPCVRVPIPEVPTALTTVCHVDFNAIDWPETERYPSGHLYRVGGSVAGASHGTAPAVTSSPPPNARTAATTPSPGQREQTRNALVYSPDGSAEPHAAGTPSRTPTRATKPAYEPHLPAEQLTPEAISAAGLVTGKLRINARNSQQAFCQVDGRADDVFIDGIWARNRAFDGDTVVFKIVQTSEQRQRGAEIARRQIAERKARNAAAKEAKAKAKAGKAPALVDAPGAPLPADPPSAGVAGSVDDDEAWEDVDSDEGSTSASDDEPEAVAMLVEDAKAADAEELLAPQRAFQAKGVVVAVLTEHKNVLLAGQLMVDEKRGAEADASGKQPTPRKATTGSVRLFKPKNTRFPAIVLRETPDIPLEALERKLLLVQLDTVWPETSQYPLGHVVRELGAVGDVEAETTGILLEHEVDFDEFSPEVIACLPPTPWSTTPEEIARRRDVRDKRVFSIDPPTARDLDDALHIEHLPDGKWEVGVHIADVSYFVPEGSALDQQARMRATTVYMVQRAIPMLPRLLCEQLCSLNPDVDRYAFSAVFVLDDDGEIHARWFGRTIMRSCARLTYDHAQHIIVGNDVDGWDAQVPGNATKQQVADDILALHRLAVKMRARRFEKGVLALNKAKLSFRLDARGIPETCSVYELKESNKLVEEFMLLANMAVAERIHQSHPNDSLLRRHPPPDPNGIRNLVNKAKLAGVTLDPSSSRTLQVSLNSIADANKRLVLQLLATIPMRPAAYFCTANSEVDYFWHYALSVPYYTHFTSPIRRYADVIVHRLLLSALATDANDAAQPYRFTLSPLDVEEIAQNCNHKKNMSKKAQEASSDLFLCIYVNRAGGVTEMATIVDLRERDVRLIVPKYALEVVVPLLDVARRAKTSDMATRPTLTVHWGERSAANSSGASSRKDETQILHVFDQVPVRITANMSTSPCRLIVKLLPPQ